MSDSTYRGAIIGLGFIGGADPVSGHALGQRVEDLDGTHLDAMRNHPRVSLVAGSSRDAGRRERFAQRSAARTYADWCEMLEHEQPDIVSVATYAPHHADITVACAERGVRAIYCEKPIATKLADAERMLRACEASQSLLVVNHNRRFNPNYRRLNELVAAGGLGELTSAALQWGSGRLGNVGTHMFNALCLVAGRRVAAVSATLDLSSRRDCRGPQFQDPGGWGLLRLTGGLITTLDAADFGKVPAAIMLNGTLGRAVAGAADVRLEFWNGRSEHWTDPAGSRKKGAGVVCAKQPPGCSGKRIPTPLSVSSMDRAMAEIVAWLDGLASFPDAPEDSLHTLETIIACHASHQRNSAWTSLPLGGADRDIEVLSG